MSRTVIIDCQIAGISGDMMLSALIDLGAERKKVIEGIYSCANHIEGCRINSVEFVKSILNGISCTCFLFDYKERHHSLSGSALYQKAVDCCDSLDLVSQPRAFVLNSFKSLISAESRVHGVDFDNVKLHETASIDTLADIIGTALAMIDLDLYNCKIYSTGVAVGSGVVKFSHGIVPNPGNAILEIFRGREFTLISGYLEGELTTPTGAAMLVNLSSHSVSSYPTLIPDKIGYGGGTKRKQSTPNVVRVLVGHNTLYKVYDSDSVYEIETNVDDLDGETVGNVIDTLYQNGAKDVILLQGITKKNRPAIMIKILSDKSHLESVINNLLSETGTLGIRVRETNRLIVKRSICSMTITVNEEIFNVRVKISKDQYGNINYLKPEFEDIKYISQKLGIPFKQSAIMVQREVDESIKGQVF
jgi:pyridinium-3,5-bisthiocarboxylic acid mononucleotide nickel chelatase